jgi:hypothetical protein
MNEVNPGKFKKLIWFKYFINQFIKNT